MHDDDYDDNIHALETGRTIQLPTNNAPILIALIIIKKILILVVLLFKLILFNSAVFLVFVA